MTASINTVRFRLTVNYRLIYDDMVRHPLKREPTSVTERLKRDPRIRGDAEWDDFKKLIKAAMLICNTYWILA